MAREFLGGFELLVLLALIRLGDEAYGVPIADARGEQRPRRGDRQRLRQAVAAIVAAFCAQVWPRKWVAAGVVMLAWMVPDLVAAVLVRSFPADRAVVLTTLVIVNVGECVPALRAASAEWLRDPGNPIWLSNVRCFAAFAYLAVPFSIMLGGRRRSFD